MAFFKPSNPPMSDWNGKRVWVVGASSGIGEATASALHARGALVIVSARNQQALRRFSDHHPGAQVLVLDTTDRHAVKQAAHTVMAQGRLDCVVYCAGYYNPMRAQTLDLDDAMRHTEVNYTGALYLLDALLPQLLAQGNTHISLVGSVAGYRGLPNSMAYGASKAALIHLAETLYLDLKATSVGVSVINPGFVDTPLTAKNSFSMPALMSTSDAAQAILKGWASGLFEIHFPKRFTVWLKLMRLLPYRIYFALVARATS